MPIDKNEAENMKIAGIVKIMNNAFADYDSNVENNEALSKELDEFIGELERGEIPSTLDFTHLLNNAMERTRSDPEADEGKFDFLKEMGQVILNVMKIPADLLHTDLLINLLKEFQGILLGSQRRHFHYRDWHWHDYIDTIFSSMEIVSPATVYPSFKRAENQQKQKRRKISFKK